MTKGGPRGGVSPGTCRAVAGPNSRGNLGLISRDQFIGENKERKNHTYTAFLFHLRRNATTNKCRAQGQYLWVKAAHFLRSSWASSRRHRPHLRLHVLLQKVTCKTKESKITKWPVEGKKWWETLKIIAVDRLHVGPLAASSGCVCHCFCMGLCSLADGKHQ